MLSKNARTLFIKYRDRIKDVQNSHIKKIRNKELEGGFSVDQIHEAVEMVSVFNSIWFSPFPFKLKKISSF